MRTLLIGLVSGAAAVAAVSLLPDRASAQSPDALSDPEPVHEALHAALRSAERSHLKRVGLWGLGNLAAGSVLALTTDRDHDPTRHGFGVQIAGWGLVNTGLAGAGLAFGGRGDPPDSLGAALRAESRWGQILVVNVGLNAGYMMAGGALLWAGSRGLDRGDELRGHASAVILQGLGLLVLDGIAWLGHRDRMDQLAEATDRE